MLPQIEIALSDAFLQECSLMVYLYRMPCHSFLFVVFHLAIIKVRKSLDCFNFTGLKPYLEPKMEYFHQNHYDLRECVTKIRRTNIIWFKFIGRMLALEAMDHPPSYQFFLSKQGENIKLYHEQK
jgi:hypothetical protein